MHWQTIISSAEERRHESWLQNKVQVPAEEEWEPWYSKGAIVSFVFEDMALWALLGMDSGEVGLP